jgi:hypothetical protein
METGRMQLRNNASKAVCNYFGAGQLHSMAGNVEANTPGQGQPRCEGCLMAENIGTLVVGYDAGDAYTIPALNTVVEAHTGTYSTDTETGTVTTNKDVFPAASYDCSPAAKLNLNQVGPDAIANAAAAYKAARGL